MASSGRRLGLDAPAPSHPGGPALSAGEHDRPIDSPISLQYPNGRVYETTLPLSEELRPGDRFELYGRHWNALRLLAPSRWKVEAPPARMLCLSTNGTRPESSTDDQRRASAARR